MKNFHDLNDRDILLIVRRMIRNDKINYTYGVTKLKNLRITYTVSIKELKKK